MNYLGYCVLPLVFAGPLLCAVVALGARHQAAPPPDRLTPGVASSKPQVP